MWPFALDLSLRSLLHFMCLIKLRLKIFLIHVHFVLVCFNFLGFSPVRFKNWFHLVFYNMSIRSYERIGKMLFREVSCHYLTCCQLPIPQWVDCFLSSDDLLLNPSSLFIMLVKCKYFMVCRAKHFHNLNNTMLFLSEWPSFTARSWAIGLLHSTLP